MRSKSCEDPPRVRVLAIDTDIDDELIDQGLQRGLDCRAGLSLCLFGLVIGLLLGIAGVRVISAVQGGEPPPGILGLSGLVAVFVIGVALLASWIPARAAARIDPLSALRVE